MPTTRVATSTSDSQTCLSMSFATTTSFVYRRCSALAQANLKRSQSHTARRLGSFIMHVKLTRVHCQAPCTFATVACSFCRASPLSSKTSRSSPLGSSVIVNSSGEYCMPKSKSPKENSFNFSRCIRSAQTTHMHQNSCQSLGRSEISRSTSW